MCVSVALQVFQTVWNKGSCYACDQCIRFQCATPQLHELYYMQTTCKSDCQIRIRNLICSSRHASTNSAQLSSVWPRQALGSTVTNMDQRCITQPADQLVQTYMPCVCFSSPCLYIIHGECINAVGSLLIPVRDPGRPGLEKHEGSRHSATNSDWCGDASLSTCMLGNRSHERSTTKSTPDKISFVAATYEIIAVTFPGWFPWPRSVFFRWKLVPRYCFNSGRCTRRTVPLTIHNLFRCPTG